MKLDKWIGPYKVQAFPWIDKKQIYVNVQYFAPGQSVERPPVWDKIIYVTDDKAGRNFVFVNTHTLVDYVSTLDILENTKTVVTVNRPFFLVGSE